MTIAASQQAQAFDREITKHIHADYLLYLPPGYAPDGSRRWPLILFLHGAGERGSDLDIVKRTGLPKFLEKGGDYPFIAVSPQCPSDESWSAEVLINLLDEVTGRYPVDPDRLYLTGLSMGGFGTWTLATEHPDRFAAIAPICGGGRPSMVDTIKHIPTWVFHGDRDRVVPLHRSEEMVEALKRAGGDVRFTVYPEAGHDSWTETYANPELYTWFLAHTRSGNE